MARPRTDIAPRILRAARSHFRKSGVDGASLRAIAREAKTSIGMVYYYFPSKDDLFFAVVEEVYGKFMNGLEQALAPEGTVEERLVRLYERLANVSEDEIQILPLIVHEALLSSQRFERIVQRSLRGHIPLVLRTLLEGIGDGTLDRKRHPIVLLLATFTLAGPAQFMRRAVDARLPIPGAPAGNELARELVDVLLHGVAARPRSGATASGTAER
jgi:AcrR family transcriptional regulator